MVRTLEAQAQAIWPGESDCIRDYGIEEGSRVLDVGCGTGEFALRLAALLPASRILGVDVWEPHLTIAREKCAHLTERVAFAQGDAFQLAQGDGEFDLVCCRHLLQLVPDPHKIVDEMIRVTRPGGRLHFLAEDYGMLFAHPVEDDSDRFWQDGAMAFGNATGTDLRIGRRMFSLLARRGLESIRVRYVVVDTLSTPRQTLVKLWKAWRDGFTEVLAHHSEFSRSEVLDFWEQLIACTRDPEGYAVWHVPIISGLLPD